jgi:WD40 repeat protein
VGEHRRHAGAFHSVTGIAFSPDGQALYSVGKRLFGRRGELVVWDLKTNRQQETLTDSGCIGVVVSHTGQTLALAAESGGVWLLKSAGGEPMRRLGNLALPYMLLAFTPDDRALIVQVLGRVELLDVETGRASEPLREGHRGQIISAKIAPDGSVLLTIDEEPVMRVWRVADWSKAREFGRPFAGFGVGLAVSPEGKLACVGSPEDPTRLIDLEHNRVRALPNRAGAFVGAGEVFSPDGRLLARDDGLFDTATGDRIAGPLIERKDTKRVLSVGWCSVCFSPDGRRIAVCDDDGGVVKVWDVLRENPTEAAPTP